jgi:hypothetical protein
MNVFQMKCIFFIYLYYKIIMCLHVMQGCVNDEFKRVKFDYIVHTFFKYYSTNTMYFYL